MTKKIFAALLAVSLIFILCACSDGGKIIAPEGEAVAGFSSGNKAVDYSFTYPDSWELAENDGVVLIRKDVNDSDMIAEYASVNVLTFGLADTNLGARDYWKQYKEDLAKTFNDFEMIGAETSGAPESVDENGVSETPEATNEGEEITLGGVAALKVRYSARITEKTYIYEQVVCCRYGNVYILTLTASNDDYESVRDAFAKVITSFVFE